MNNKQQNLEAKEGHQRPSGSEVRVWWLVFLRELSELWIWGKALVLIIIFSVLLGIMAFLLATNSQLDLIPPKEMIFLMLQASIAFGLLIGLIIGADSISGERERATLETLLLTPASRRQIIMGKFLAAISPWPVALVISIPYLVVLSQGDEVLASAILWGALMGSILAPAFTGFGILMSIWSNSNKTSTSLSLVVYVICLIPTQFPGTAQAGFMGQFVKKINPMEAANHFLEKIVVNNRTLEELWIWLIAPLLWAVLVFGALFWYVAPKLRLEAGKSNIFYTYWARLVGILAVAFLVVSLNSTPALALHHQEEQGQEEGTEGEAPEEEGAVSQEEMSPEEAAGAPESAAADMGLAAGASMNAGASSIEVSIDKSYQIMNAGEQIQFNTIVTYNGPEDESSPLIVAMNIINLDGEGDPVDPEDWSPERTQYIEALGAGESESLSWTINAILDGDFIVYMVVIPEPDGSEATSHPVTSSGIHLTVSPFTRLNPGGVLPFTIAIPLLLLAGLGVLLWLRRKRTDPGVA